MKKSIYLIVATVALAVGLSLSWYLNSNKTIELEEGTWFGEQARALPEFELVDHNNDPVTRNSMRGKWNLMFFGFTHCPDICPTALQTMDLMVQAIDDPDVKSDVEVYFVSVDPERDTLEILGEYVGYFNPGFIASTAAEAKLRELTGPLGIVHEIHKKSEDDENYGVDHSGSIVLINPDAEYAGLFSPPHNPAAMARDMTRIVEYN